MGLKVCWFRHETIGSFKELRRHFELVQSLIGEASTLEKYVIESQPVPDQEAYNDYLATLHSHEQEYRKTIPRIMGYTFITALFSETEYQLQRLCKELQQKKELPLSIGQINGNMAEKVQIYFKAFELPPLQSVESQLLKELTLVRNCVVHCSGAVSAFRDAERLKQVVKEKAHEGLCLDYDYSSPEDTVDEDDDVKHSRIVAGENRLRVSLSYCFESLDAVVTMFRRVFDELGFVPENVSFDP